MQWIVKLIQCLTKEKKAMDVATDSHVELPEAIQEEGSMIPYLPSGIMTDILLRLPAECIFQLRQRNDLLRHLTTTPYFKRAHLNRATPNIVVQSHNNKHDSNIKLFLFDGKAESTVATSLAITSFNKYGSGYPIYLRSSYEGFLIFKSRDYPPQSRDYPAPILCILNPVTKEQVILTSSSCTHSYFCGFYFHPRRKEYEVICVRRLNLLIWEFEILGLRSKLRRSVGRYSYPPSNDRWPALVNGIFYWMVDGCYSSTSNAIISFNIETEELRAVKAVFPFAELYLPVDTFKKLIELDGDLCLFDAWSPSAIWVLNNTTKRWDKKDSIASSPDNEQNWDFGDYFTDADYIQTKGEFVAYHQWHGNKPPYIYNLRLGTWKLLERTGFEDNRCEAAMNYTPSLVSLDVADSVIPF